VGLCQAINLVGSLDRVVRDRSPSPTLLQMTFCNEALIPRTKQRDAVESQCMIGGQSRDLRGTMPDLCACTHQFSSRNAYR
jgi:hypothetical protein